MHKFVRILDKYGNSGTSGSEHRLNLQPWLFQCASVPSQVETEPTLKASRPQGGKAGTGEKRFETPT